MRRSAQGVRFRQLDGLPIGARVGDEPVIGSTGLADKPLTAGLHRFLQERGNRSRRFDVHDWFDHLQDRELESALGRLQVGITADIHDAQSASQVGDLFALTLTVLAAEKGRFRKGQSRLSVERAKMAGAMESLVQFASLVLLERKRWILVSRRLRLSGNNHPRVELTEDGERNAPEAVRQFVMALSN